MSGLHYPPTPHSPPAAAHTVTQKWGCRLAVLASCPPGALCLLSPGCHPHLQTGLISINGNVPVPNPVATSQSLSSFSWHLRALLTTSSSLRYPLILGVGMLALLAGALSTVPLPPSLLQSTLLSARTLPAVLVWALCPLSPQTFPDSVYSTAVMNRGRHLESLPLPPAPSCAGDFQSRESILDPVGPSCPYVQLPDRQFRLAPTLAQHDQVKRHGHPATSVHWDGSRMLKPSCSPPCPPSQVLSTLTLNISRTVSSSPAPPSPSRWNHIRSQLDFCDHSLPPPLLSPVPSGPGVSSKISDLILLFLCLKPISDSSLCLEETRVF